MIKLTPVTPSDNPIYLNSEYIVAMHEQKGTTRIWDTASVKPSDYWLVKETPEQILAMLNYEPTANEITERMLK